MLNWARNSGSLLVRGVALAMALFCAAAIVISPPAQAQTYSVLHSFGGVGDGMYPYNGVTLDRSGNVYGTTFYGGPGASCFLGCGIAFRLTHHGSSWIYAPLYGFAGGADGGNSYARLILGPDGTFYGTTTQGGGSGCFGMGCGTVFNLRPPGRVCTRALCPWTETVIYRFNSGSDGADPTGADLVFDQAGDIYGTTNGGGPGDCEGGCGTVYKLTRSNGSWTESVIHSFLDAGGDGQRPWAGVILDQSGNLYGTTTNGGNHQGNGTVYELAPSGSGWQETILYNFQGGSDGQYPYGGLVADGAGNLYGTTCCAGSFGGGTAFELMRSANWAFSVIHQFTGLDGQGPEGGMIMDAAGNLYGSTNEEGAYGFGMIYELTPGSGGWTLTSLHDFCAGGPPCSDGYIPLGSLVFDAEGDIYGTTADGGMFGGGVAFEIAP